MTHPSLQETEGCLIHCEVHRRSGSSVTRAKKCKSLKQYGMFQTLYMGEVTNHKGEDSDVSAYWLWSREQLQFTYAILYILYIHIYSLLHVIIVLWCLIWSLQHIKLVFVVCWASRTSNHIYQHFAHFAKLKYGQSVKFHTDFCISLQLEGLGYQGLLRVVVMDGGSVWLCFLH